MIYFQRDKSPIKGRSKEFRFFLFQSLWIFNRDWDGNIFYRLEF